MADALISCEKCGAQYPKRPGTGNQRRFCDACRPLVMKGWRGLNGEWVSAAKTIGSAFTCVDCQQAYPATGSGQKRCTGCRRLNARKMSQRWRQKSGYKRPDAKSPVGSTIECPACKAAHQKQTANGLYCETCRPVSYRHRYRTQPAVKAKAAMSKRLRRALKGRKDGPAWSKYFAYSVAEFMAHIERQFTKGMNWENYGEWHVDHIRPVASFDLTTEEGIKACFAMTNLRPLWADLNKKKSDRRLFLI